MSITLSGTTVTFNDSTTQTTAGIGSTYVPPVDIQTWTAAQGNSTQYGGTWTKPTAGQTMAQIELWGGGGGSTGGGGGGCGGGYTIFQVPLAQLPATLTTNAVGNASSTNGGSGQAASITAFTAQSGWMGTTQGLLNASAGSLNSSGGGYMFGPIGNSGGGKTGNSGGYPWGGTGGNASGNTPGGGSGANGGNGGTQGGASQVRITCW